MTENHIPVVLTIQSGVHAGATLPLHDNALLLLGTASDCDIQMADENIQARHCAILKHSDSIALRSIDGEVTVNRTVVPKGKTTEYLQPKLARLAGTEVSFTISAQYQPTANSRLEDKPPDKKRLRKYCQGLLIAGLFCGVITYAQLSSINAQEETQGAALLPVANDIIARLGLNDKVKILGPVSPGILPVIQGVLDQSSGESLQRALTDSAVNVQWQVTYVEELLDRVTNIFRTNGYTAELEYSGGATINVLNLDNNNTEVQRVAAHIHTDVPELETLSFANDVSSAPTDSSPSLYALLPGKRLTTIVDGTTAYIATEDGSRYFVGSVLPGGSQIRVISDAGVQVDYNGTLTWMRF